MKEDFFIENKIYYHDTDAGGVVYYANYLKHLEEGRNEFCAKLGLDMRGLAAAGIWFVVARVEIDYKAAARYLDIIRIYTAVENTGRCTVDFSQRIKRQEEIITEAKVKWVCVGQDFKARAIPPEVIKLLKS
ncbi:MAG: acyl-CoA thioesterase [Candidatus Omnitrophica bacterium]|nr:acyl-CoA thioesterase [Candidatus Omnitrophota bacterium]MBU1925289.1 acyl-CoA thioesterase [Candidatus Omnitrophota bacterium]